MRNLSTRALIPLFGSLCLFLALAVLGWIKLRYGFSLIDEGMYMTDGWRLAAGDRLFPDSAISAAMLYAVFNAAVFKLHPDITLLGFRQLQFAIALLVIAVFGTAVYRWNRRHWLIVLTLSIFAFTGLDVAGISSNLSNYTYPHLFFVLHVSLMLFAIKSRHPGVRVGLFLLAGVALWCVGFSLLPLSATLIIPLLVWLAMRSLGSTPEVFSLREMMMATLPGVLLWAIFIGLHREFLPAILDIYRYVKEGGVADTPFDWVAAQYVAVTAGVVAVVVAATRQPTRVSAVAFGLFAVSMYYVIDTNVFGQLPLFWQGWFSKQMWLCALLIVTMAALLGHLAYRRHRGVALDQGHLLLLLLLLPSAVFTLVFTHYSSLGVLVTSYVAFPVCLALALFIFARLENLHPARYAAAAVIAVLLPFYYHLARADWEFTYFDLPPRHLTQTLTDGFGAGIRTTEFSEATARWMAATAAAHSRAGDYAIVMEQMPMGYMLIKRRPALNHSWTGWAYSETLRRDAVKAMVQQQREPALVYRFLRKWWLLPAPTGEGDFAAGDPISYAPDDPILRYVASRMKRVETFRFRNVPIAELYVRSEGAPVPSPAR